MVCGGKSPYVVTCDIPAYARFQRPSSSHATDWSSPVHRCTGAVSPEKLSLTELIICVPGVHNLVAIAGRITFVFMNYGRQCFKDSFISLHCFCSAPTR